MIGISAYGAYIPRMRLNRSAVTAANAWFAPGMVGKGKGTRSMGNWDEDSITMAVAAARDCLGRDENRSYISAAYLASTTFPFADRLNSGLLAAALTLDEGVEAVDMGGSQRAGLSALTLALGQIKAGKNNILVAASDRRKALAASTQELNFGDGAAAFVLGSDNVLAEFLGSAVITTDFVDHFRASGSELDYHWEERWVRDAGVSKIVPPAISNALTNAGVKADEVTHFILPSVFKRLDTQVAKSCGIAVEAVVNNLSQTVGDTGVAHGMLMFAQVLEQAKAGDVIVLTQFGQGAEVLVFRVTDAIASFKPLHGVSGWLARGVEENNYTRFLAYNNLLALETGMRGEQDKKTALSTHYRHKDMIQGLVAGRCKLTGEVHFPPTRLSYTEGAPALDTQEPYKLADRFAHIMSWSADHLGFTLSPPNQYGLVDFEGGGRFTMEFTDVAKGDVETGMKMEMVFRIKDVDSQRKFKRYFWKATPVRDTQ